MNKVLKGLLVTVLAVGAAHADHHTNKTFLMPRPTGVDLPMEYTTFDELITRKAEDKFGGNFQVVPFYKDSNSDHEQGEYFLVNKKDKIKIYNQNVAAAKTTINDDVDLGYIVHDSQGATAGAHHYESFASLDPREESYGVRFDYHQDLDKILKGLYLKVNLPVVHVENDPKFTVESSSTLATNIGAAAATSLKTTLESFFRGDLELNAAGANNNLVKKLTHGKINGHQDETGVADIDVALGYKILNKENYHLGLAIAITIPTGNDADGNYMFEPIVGNGGHFGLGGDLIAGARVWGDLDQNIKLYLKMKYRYLFESSETRTFGLKDRLFGQYYMLSEVNAAGAVVQNTQLTPAANITTLDTDVTPGSQFDGVLGFAYNNGGFTFDLGYNLYYRECEDLHRKGNIPKQILCRCT